MFQYNMNATTILHFVSQMQKLYYAYITADSEHCFDLSGVITAVGVAEKVFANSCNWYIYKLKRKVLLGNVCKVLSKCQSHQVH